MRYIETIGVRKGFKKIQSLTQTPRKIPLLSSCPPSPTNACPPSPTMIYYDLPKPPMNKSYYKTQLCPSFSLINISSSRVGLHNTLTEPEQKNITMEISGTEIRKEPKSWKPNSTGRIRGSRTGPLESEQNQVNQNRTRKPRTEQGEPM